MTAKADLLAVLDAVPAPDPVPMEGPQGPVVRLGGTDVLMLASNDYLGLAAHEAVVAAASRATLEYGAGLASVRPLAGDHVLHRELESRLAAFLGVDDAALLPSCWAANESVFLTLASPPGHTAPATRVYSDELNHASIIDGIALAKARVRSLELRRFRHAALDQLEALLAADAGGDILRIVVTDGVFSMEGDTADVAGLLALADRFDAVLVVDDSHGIGVSGPTGRGTTEGAGTPDLITGTLGKALGGSIGGFAAGRGELVRGLRAYARPYAFSNALPPAAVASALAALDVLEREPDRAATARGNAARLRAGLSRLGYDVLPGDHAIVAVMIGDEGRAAALSAALGRAGVFCRPISFPMVPRGAARLRAQVSAAHTAAHLERALDAFAAVR